MSHQVRKVGDTYPPLIFGDGAEPVDLTGVELTYDFVPDSKRAKTRRNVPLRPMDAPRGVFHPPRARTSGWCEVTLRFPNGDCRRCDPIRFERGFP